MLDVIGAGATAQAEHDWRVYSGVAFLHTVFIMSAGIKFGTIHLSALNCRERSKEFIREESRAARC